MSASMQFECEPRRGRQRRRGFTLLEVVLAMGVLALGASALLALFSYGALVSSGARTRVEAAAALRIVAFDLEEQLFPLLEDGSVGEPRTFTDREVLGQPRLRWSARAEPAGIAPDPPGAPLLYRVEIELSWRSDGRRESLSKRLLLPRSVDFGERLRQRFGPARSEPDTVLDSAPDPAPDSAPGGLPANGAAESSTGGASAEPPASANER